MGVSPGLSMRCRGNDLLVGWWESRMESADKSIFWLCFKERESFGDVERRADF